MTRRFESFSRSIALSRLPTPGPCTSTAMKSTSGRALAMATVVSPMPEPISRTSLRAEAIFSEEKAMPYLGYSSSSARFCAVLSCLGAGVPSNRPVQAAFGAIFPSVGELGEAE